MTYSLPFREKFFATKDKFDLTFEKTSQQFDIPIRTLFRWQQKIALCVTRDKPATKIDMDALDQHVDDSQMPIRMNAQPYWVSLFKRYTAP